MKHEDGFSTTNRSWQHLCVLATMKNQSLPTGLTHIHVPQSKKTIKDLFGHQVSCIDKGQNNGQRPIWKVSLISYHPTSHCHLVSHINMIRVLTCGHSWKPPIPPWSWSYEPAITTIGLRVIYNAHGLALIKNSVWRDRETRKTERDRERHRESI